MSEPTRPVASAFAARDRRRQIVLLRGLLIVAVGGMLVHSGVRSAGVAALVLLIAFALSDLLLGLLRLDRMGTPRFDLLVGAVDLVLVGLGIHLADAASGALPVSCLLMVLVVALAHQTINAVAGAAAVGALHAWLVLDAAAGAGAVADLGRQLLLQILFLSSVGLYYGFLTAGIHRRRVRAAEGVRRRELETLLDILNTVTSSLDLIQVTRAVVRKLNTVVPSVRCSILYVDEEMNRCTVMASHDHPEMNVLDIDLAKYPEIREALRTRSAVIVQDVSKDPLMHEVRDQLRAVDFRSIAVIPLTFGDDVLGTLCLKTARSGDAFGDDEIKFCTAVARASSNALKNAILHRRVVEASARSHGMGQKLARILNHSPDPILTTDEEGRITEFNWGAERLLGFSRDEVLGRPCSLLVGEGRQVELLEGVLNEGLFHDSACPFLKKDGGQLEVELSMALLRDEEQEVEGTVWIGRDVSELRRAQMQLLQREKLSTIGEVISGVAHELNNPLSGVIGFSQLLLARHESSPMLRQLQKINDSATRCQKIVKNLLSFARAHQPERKLLGINGIIEKTLDLKKYQLRVNDVEVVADLDRDVPCTMLDFHQMQQVLLNLINNAQHAMNKVRERPGRIEIRTSSENGWIRVEFSDNGEGMDTETVERIFDPFFTTKQPGEGTGLGLSVSYGIIEEHGGRIRAEGRPGQGARFIIELPVVRQVEEQPATAVAKGRDEAPVRGAGKRILVVDDEPTILDLLIDVLEEEGYRVDTAANGNEAFAKIDTNDYDLVITDVRMPQMNGLDLYRKILATRPDLEGRVVFITGDLVDNETVNFLAEIDPPTIPKPFELATIASIVNETLLDDRAEA